MAAAAAAAAGAASSHAPSTSARRLPFRPTRKPLLSAFPKKTLTTSTLSRKSSRLLHPVAASSSSSPPPPEDADTTDPVKLAFARAAAYKKERANPTPKPPPPPPQPSAKESSGGKGAFDRALEYRNGNGEGLDGGSPRLNASPTFGYGGGRNISLGGETQSAEEKAAKDKRTRELLAAYLGRQNKTLDAKTKAECTKALKEGDELMNAGRLQQALPYYEKVMQAADFKTEVHGMAALQWSICLDSLCRSKEAMSMYSKLKYHPNTLISKKAKMFMFSFQAADFLKVDGVPVPRNTGYEGYFDQFGGQRNYYANPDEPEVGIRQIIPYMLFLVSPIFFVAFVALRKSLML